MNSVYRQKVELLLRIIPFVTEEECFAIHGGTAINLFHTDIPRLSVDIDLTYIPVQERVLSLANISAALVRIAERMKRSIKGMHIIMRLDVSKLTCEYRGIQIKVEVNQTKRGIVGGKPQILPLSPKAQNDFGLYVEARIVPPTLLYGGKIAAALSRQHPRDLFDIKHMKIPVSETKLGFMLSLLGSDRPFYESFAPNLLDQREAMINQFNGMSDEPFSYDDFEATRSKLIAEINALMTEEDKSFLLSFESAEPQWDKSAYTELQHYPSVKWKLLNLRELKKSNPQKLYANVQRLREIFLRLP